tara:strand:+ start:1688 stop:2137 length:450 start_codon:yes stop_codon:yes gene_type:complete
MSFPRVTNGAVPIVDRRTVTLTSSVTTSATYGSITNFPREGFIRRVRAKVKDGSGGLPFEISLYETNPEGSDGTDGIHRVATYRVTEPNVGVFPASTDYILDSEEELYYQVADKTSGTMGTLYYSVKTLTGTANSVELRIEVELAGGAY